MRVAPGGGSVKKIKGVSFLFFRGGPLDILGGGVSDPKKNSCKKLNYKKKFLHALEERKKIRATS